MELILAVSVKEAGVGSWVVVALIVVILLYFGRNRLTATSTRPCPRCGRDVKKGQLDCPHCGFDFRTIGTTANREQDGS